MIIKMIKVIMMTKVIIGNISHRNQMMTIIVMILEIILDVEAVGKFSSRR